MRIQTPPHRRLGSVELPSPKPPARMNQEPPPRPSDKEDIDWAAVRTAAYRGGAVALAAGAAGGLLLRGGLYPPAAALFAGSLGASAAVLAFDQREAALPGAFIGVASAALYSNFGLTGVFLGAGLGALFATAAEIDSQENKQP